VNLFEAVLASSLYEAAVLALVEFKKSVFAVAAVGPGTRLKVAVEAPNSSGTGDEGQAAPSPRPGVVPRAVGDATSTAAQV